ncbi:MAG: hypothetical protein COZ18_15045 [Flexibacter sp. CG_4_10_14_3_um_filter_32_15]|nr:MAG: hypothetical protein COZ18_15045 [Flexibacter sp. CG_4_10_14_3_um_filter_32_15]
MRSFAEFKALFDEDLLPQLEELKRELSWRNIFQFGIVIALAIILSILFVLIAMELVAIWAVVILSIFLIAGAIWQVRNLADRRDIQLRYKKTVNSKLIEFVAPRGEYDSEGFVPYSDFLDSELFKREPDYYGGDDLLTTNQNGVEVKFSEVKAAWEEQSEDIKGNDSSQWHVIFDGIFMVSSLSKSFPDMIIIPDISKGSFGRLGYETKKANEQHGEFVDVEHPEFNDYFTAYAKDAKKAKSMISEEFMDRAVEVAQTIEEPIYFSFKGRKMYVAIHYEKPMFEFNTYLANITNPEKPYEIFKEMDFLVSIGSSLNSMQRREVSSMDSFGGMDMGGMGSLGSMSSKDINLTDEEIRAMMEGE